MNYLALFLAVALGYVIATFFLKSKKVKYMPQILAFSGSFLLSITLFELLPEVFEEPSKRIGMLIMAGILLQIVLESLSKGAEHGHVHVRDTDKNFPWLLFIGLSVHALIEGFPVDGNQGMLIGVIVHKIPIAIILALFFSRANYKKSTAFIFLMLFALMTPIGNLMSKEVVVLAKYHLEINAIAIGIFLHVSTTILFESSKDHKFNMAKLVSIVLGIVIAYFL